MSNGNSALPLGLGAGSGILFWYFLRGEQPGTHASAPTPSAANQSPSASAAAAPAAPPCMLHLDASGFTADGARVGVAEAVRRCKLTGRADVTVKEEASAAIYADLMSALGRAEVPTFLHCNRAGSCSTHSARNTDMNQDRPPVWFAGAESLDKLFWAQVQYLAKLRGADRMAPEADMTGGVMLIPRSTNGEVIQLAEFWGKALNEPKAKQANGYDTVHARWSAAQRDLEAHARSADPNAVYPKNHAFWRAVASVAVHVSASLKYGLSDAQRWMASVGQGMQTAYDRTKAMAAEVRDTAVDVASGAGKVISAGARGLLGGLGTPLLIGGGIAAAVLLLRGRGDSARGERSR